MATGWLPGNRGSVLRMNMEWSVGVDTELQWIKWKGYGWGGMEWNTGGLFTHACIKISALGLHGATRSVTASCWYRHKKIKVSWLISYYISIYPHPSGKNDVFPLSIEIAGMELAENFHPHADGRDKASCNPPSFPYHPHSTFRIKTQGGANLIPYLYFVTSQITEFLPSFLPSFLPWRKSKSSMLYAI